MCKYHKVYMLCVLDLREKKKRKRKGEQMGKGCCPHIIVIVSIYDTVFLVDLISANKKELADDVKNDN